MSKDRIGRSLVTLICGDYFLGVTDPYHVDNCIVTGGGVVTRVSKQEVDVKWEQPTGETTEIKIPTIRGGWRILYGKIAAVDTIQPEPIGGMIVRITQRSAVS